MLRCRLVGANSNLAAAAAMFEWGKGGGVGVLKAEMRRCSSGPIHGRRRLRQRMLQSRRRRCEGSNNDATAVGVVRRAGCLVEGASDLRGDGAGQVGKGRRGVLRLTPTRPRPHPPTGPPHYGAGECTMSVSGLRTVRLPRGLGDTAMISAVSVSELPSPATPRAAQPIVCGGGRGSGGTGRGG